MRGLSIILPPETTPARRFFADNPEREIFIATLNAVVKLYNLLCHAYFLMDNHNHRMIEITDANLFNGMRLMNGIYTQRYSRRHGKEIPYLMNNPAASYRELSSSK